MANLIEPLPMDFMDFMNDIQQEEGSLRKANADFFPSVRPFSAVEHGPSSFLPAQPPAAAVTIMTNMAAPSPSRMVSVGSMSLVNRAPAKPSSSRTMPFDSLKDLVKNMRRSRAFKPSVKLPTKPSAFLPQAFYGRPQTVVAAPAPKRLKPEAESALHRACATGHTEAIVKLLAEDRVMAAQPMDISSKKMVYNFGSYQMEEQEVEEAYKYALNLAIRNGVETPTLEALIKVAPRVLVTPDGSAEEIPLSVLLKTNPSDLTTIDKFLLANPDCVRLVDRQGNTPLHVAVQHGASLDAIRHLVILYPEALRCENRHSETPVGVAQRASRCSEEVAAYLWEKYAESF